MPAQACIRSDGAVYPYSPERAQKPNFRVEMIPVPADLKQSAQEEREALKAQLRAELAAELKAQTDPAGQAADAEAAKKPSGKK